MSHNITFTTPAKLKFAEKWFKTINNLQLTINNFNSTSSLLAIIVCNFSGKNLDPLPYYRFAHFYFHEAN